MIAFSEGDRVAYTCATDTLPSGPAVVLDVLVEGDRTEPAYVIDLGFGAVLACSAELA